MRRGVVVAAVAALVGPFLAAAPIAYGGTETDGRGDESPQQSGPRFVTDPWSVSLTSQLLAPADARTSTWDGAATEQLILDDSDPGRLALSWGAASGDFEQLELVAPVPGLPLRAGFYGHAVPVGSEDTSHPQMRFLHDSCPNFAPANGSVDIRTLHRDADGDIDRLWLVVEERCAAPGGPIRFGEIRVGAPAAGSASLRAAPAAVRWPHQTAVGDRGSIVPVRVSAVEGQEPVAPDVSLVGRGREQFAVLGDDCNGPSIRAECTVDVAFAPQAPGPHSAWLAVGDELRVRLEARALPGVTSWGIDYDAGHALNPAYPDAASHETRLPHDWWMIATEHGGAIGGAIGLVTGSLSDGHLDSASVDFYPGTGETFEPRVTYPFTDQAQSPRVDVDLGPGRRCSQGHGWFRFPRLHHGPDGELRRASVRLSHVCDEVEGVTGRMRADLRYRVGTDLVRPGVVTAVELVRGAGVVTGSFTSPTEPDLAGAVVRWYPGTARAPLHPTAGHPGEVTGFETFQLPPGSADGPVTVAVFVHDIAGNVSRPAIDRLP